VRRGLRAAGGFADAPGGKGASGRGIEADDPPQAAAVRADVVAADVVAARAA